jgi:hypothetical protein
VPVNSTECGLIPVEQLSWIQTTSSELVF